MGAFLLLTLLPRPVWGQQRTTCGLREDALTALGELFEELPVAQGVLSGNVIIEVLTSENGETWSLIFTGTDGLSCLLSHGTNWLRLEPPDYSVFEEET